MTWRKSSHSQASDCLEWRTSSHSTYNGDYAELAPGTFVRDSKLRDDDLNISPVLRFTSSAWGKFIAGIKEGKEDDR